MLPSQAREDPAGEGLWRTSEATWGDLKVTWGDLKVTWEGPRGSCCDFAAARTRISLILDRPPTYFACFTEAKSALGQGSVFAAVAWGRGPSLLVAP